MYKYIVFLFLLTGCFIRSIDMSKEDSFEIPVVLNSNQELIKNLNLDELKECNNIKIDCDNKYIRKYLEELVLSKKYFSPIYNYEIYYKVQKIKLVEIYFLFYKFYYINNQMILEFYKDKKFYTSVYLYQIGYINIPNFD